MRRLPVQPHHPGSVASGNRERWAELEAAKRRLFYTLDFLGLPYGSAADGFSPPLAFDFKADTIPEEGFWRWMGQGERVYTGHADGTITINIREADSVEREKLRVDLGEAHRTLIGHFRHEIGHYYWDLLVRGQHEDGFKALFGDHEDPPYQDAMARHYGEGPPPDWRDRFVSAYATMHPWEDWAETFALYLDITSVLDTAVNMGLIGPVDFSDLQAMVGRYRQLGLVLNELNREMGLIDVVPEVLHAAVVEKLGFVHTLVRQQAPGG
ncbi:putative zinc-binding metallopeptidase [Methyloceanibacter superfactus]|uniref:putative zinc-binding metallopeptidase n=1 Tax=Methyloceanibacter superfactus TaxID=1774969 RepID=UPI001FCD556B|nr:putative zinc-binding metallopeptidase [Methyloceanibacter superfactus]